MSDTIHFYTELPVLKSFFQVSDRSRYKQLPDDWCIGVTDIKGSTKAIINEKYRWVNILGASPIIGLMNEIIKAEIPFSFGGDGCVVCFPAAYLESVKKVFAAARYIGHSAYQMDLRAAIYPVTMIRKYGYDTKVARFKVSEFYNQAVFSGGGIQFAERLLKSGGQPDFEIRKAETADDVDFSGLECRWQEIGHDNRSVYSILIQSNPAIENSEVYERVLKKMQQIFGNDSTINPVSVESLRMSLSRRKLSGELTFRTEGKSVLSKLLYYVEVVFRVLLGKWFMKFDTKTAETDWSLYKPDMVRNNDYRKFDDMLRFVISSGKEDFETFRAYLQDEFKDDQLAFGIHRSSGALITCMVFAWHRQHIHFVDGSNGGYVKAARELKDKMNQLNREFSSTESS